VPSPRERPIPAGGRPKPNLAAAKPRATALYDYSPNDTDEIGFAQGEVVEVLREGERKKERKRDPDREYELPLLYNTFKSKIVCNRQIVFNLLLWDGSLSEIRGEKLSTKFLA
jgi:hypothetical protein